MPLERKSANRTAFDHYLRTGERLTPEEWFLRAERKFNPYHDEIGRFTSPPGVTVSYSRSRSGPAARNRQSSGSLQTTPAARSLQHAAT